MRSRIILALFILLTLAGCTKEKNYKDSDSNNNEPIEIRYQKYMEDLEMRSDNKILKVATNYTGKCGEQYAASEIVLSLDNNIYVDASYKTGLENNLFVVDKELAKTTIENIYDIMKITYGSCNYVDVLALDKNGELFYVNNYLGDRMLTLTKIQNVSYISSARVVKDKIYAVDIDGKEYDITHQIHEFNPEYK